MRKFGYSLAKLCLLCALVFAWPIGLRILSTGCPHSCAANALLEDDPGQTGPEHKLIAEYAGTYAYDFHMVVEEKDRVLSLEINKGEASMESLFGGRFLLLKLKSDGAGLGPDEMLGLMGFDRVLGQYNFVWIDNARTGMSIGEGAPPGAGKPLELLGVESRTPDNRNRKFRVEWIKTDRNRLLLCWSFAEADGSLKESLRIELVRK